MGPLLVLSRQNLIPRGEQTFQQAAQAFGQNKLFIVRLPFTFVWMKVPVFNKIGVYSNKTTGSYYFTANNCQTRQKAPSSSPSKFETHQSHTVHRKELEFRRRGKSLKKKSEYVSVHATKAYRGRRLITPLIHNLGTR